jgi:IclR family transcriptional regulator, KDG regulon repressor
MSDARRSEQAHSQHLQGDLPPGDMPIRAVAAAVHLPPSLPPMPASQHPPAAPHGDGPVTKALILLDAFANAAEPLRFSQLMERLPFPKATLHRMLKSLTDERMLSFSPQHGTYQLGPRLIRLAHAAWANGSLVDAARPVLDGLHAQLGKTIHLAQLDDGQVLYLDKRVGARGMAMYSRAGKIGPAYCTGVGKAMLAFLPPAALEASLLRQSFSRYTPTTLTSRASLMRCAVVATPLIARNTSRASSASPCPSLLLMARCLAAFRPPGRAALTTSCNWKAWLRRSSRPPTISPPMRPSAWLQP